MPNANDTISSDDPCERENLGPTSGRSRNVRGSNETQEQSCKNTKLPVWSTKPTNTFGTPLPQSENSDDPKSPHLWRPTELSSFQVPPLNTKSHTLDQAWLVSRSSSILSSTIPITLFRLWNRRRNFAVVEIFHNLRNSNSHHLRLEIFCGTRRTRVRNSGLRARPREMHVITKETGSAPLWESTACERHRAYTWS